MVNPHTYNESDGTLPRRREGAHPLNAAQPSNEKAGRACIMEGMGPTDARRMSLASLTPHRPKQDHRWHDRRVPFWPPLIGHNSYRRMSNFTIDHLMIQIL